MCLQIDRCCNGGFINEEETRLHMWNGSRFGWSRIERLRHRPIPTRTQLGITGKCSNSTVTISVFLSHASWNSIGMLFSDKPFSTPAADSSLLLLGALGLSCAVIICTYVFEPSQWPANNMRLSRAAREASTPILAACATSWLLLSIAAWNSDTRRR